MNTLRRLWHYLTAPNVRASEHRAGRMWKPNTDTLDAHEQAKLSPLTNGDGTSYRHDTDDRAA